MTTTAPDTRPADASRPRLLDIEGVRHKLGGTRPVDAATVYRSVQAGTLPKPLKFGRIARWLESEIDEVIQRRADARTDAGTDTELSVPLPSKS